MFLTVLHAPSAIKAVDLMASDQVSNSHVSKCQYESHLWHAHGILWSVAIKMAKKLEYNQWYLKT